VRHIIFASSVDVYGIPRTLPVREEHALGPVTDYARVKADDEQILREHCDQSGQTLTILRITHIYGPGEPVIKAIPRFMTMIINGQTPVIFGDGSDLRDFIFVEDVTRAFLCAMRNGSPDTYIIATGTSVTIRQVLDLIIDISGKSIGSTFQERQTSKIDLRFDTSKARNGLGFTAQTPLMAGLRAEYDWFVRHSG
jgi:nucleoside-diphosphate-sugar epimerase